MYMAMLYNHTKLMGMLPLLPYNPIRWENSILRDVLMVALVGRILLATPNMRLVARSRNEPNLRHRFEDVSDFFTSSSTRYFILFIDSLPRKLLQL